MMLLQLIYSAMIAALASATTSVPTTQQPHMQNFKIGLMAPWSGTFEDFSALTSASAVSIAMERINADPTLGDKINLTLVLFFYFSILYKLN